VQKEGEQKRKADDSGNTERKLKLAKAYETRIEEVSSSEDLESALLMKHHLLQH
jgi:hypothetical protein